MSILKEYEKNKENIGSEKYDAIYEYLKEVSNKMSIEYSEELDKIDFSSINYKNEIIKLRNKYKNNMISLDDVLHKKEEWLKFEMWYNENHLKRDIKILNTWVVDDEEIYCNAILYENNKQVANITASFDEYSLKYSIGNEESEMSDDFIKKAFKILIYDDFKYYVELPKISKCSKLLKEIYDSVCSTDSSMCHITDEEWEELYSEDYDNKDFENLKLEVENLGLQEVIGINDYEYKIIGYADLETRFNDDRHIKAIETDVVNEL